MNNTDNKIYFQRALPAAEPTHGRASSVHMRGPAGQGPLGSVDEPRQPVRELRDGKRRVRMLQQRGRARYAGQCAAAPAPRLLAGAPRTRAHALRHRQVSRHLPKELPQSQLKAS